MAMSGSAVSCEGSLQCISDASVMLKTSVCPPFRLLLPFVSTARLWQDPQWDFECTSSWLPGLHWPCDLVSLSALPDLIHCTNELNVSIPHLADTLLERSSSSSWIVVFKALIATHHLMMYGNEVSRGAPSPGWLKGATALSPVCVKQGVRTNHTQAHTHTQKRSSEHICLSPTPSGDIWFSAPTQLLSNSQSYKCFKAKSSSCPTSACEEPGWHFKSVTTSAGKRHRTTQHDTAQHQSKQPRYQNTTSPWPAVCQLVAVTSIKAPNYRAKIKTEIMKGCLEDLFSSLARMWQKVAPLCSGQRTARNGGVSGADRAKGLKSGWLVGQFGESAK